MPCYKEYKESPTQLKSGKLEISIGNMISRFKVKEWLAQGTFGNVYKVSNNGSKYALKMVQLTRTSGLIVVDPMREIIMSRKAAENKSNSSNADLIVTVLDSFIYKEHLCIQFPLMGCDLHTCRKHKNFSHFKRSVFRNIAFQTLKAVEYLHLNSIIHTDIKLDNIVFTNPKILSMLEKSADLFHHQKLDVKLIDLGLSRSKNENRNATVSALRNRPPEVIQQGQFQETSDVWSLGVCLFVLWVGFTVFKGDTEEKQIAMYTTVLKDDPRDMDTFDENVKTFIRERNKKKPGSIQKLCKYRGKDGKGDVIFSFLLKSMLIWHPERRISATEAIQHPFFGNTLKQFPN